MTKLLDDKLPYIMQSNISVKGKTDQRRKQKATFVDF